MAGAHENLEQAEHAAHAAQANKKIALLISVLALFLAFSETLGKSAQTNAITLNVASNDLWAFFQAKTIRITVLNTAAEQMQIEADRATDAALKTRLSKNIDTWKKNIARYHQYAIASAAFQIGIVLASAEVITGMAMLGWLSGLLGVCGLGFMALGLWAPHALDFLTHAAH